MSGITKRTVLCGGALMAALAIAGVAQPAAQSAGAQVPALSLGNECRGSYPGLSGPNPCVILDAQGRVIGGMVSEHPSSGNPCAVPSSEACKLFPG